MTISDFQFFSNMHRNIWFFFGSKLRKTSETSALDKNHVEQHPSSVNANDPTRPQEEVVLKLFARIETSSFKRQN